MNPSGETIQELSLQGLLSPVRGARPCYSLTALNDGSQVLVHEETVCILYLLNFNICLVEKEGIKVQTP